MFSLSLYAVAFTVGLCLYWFLYGGHSRKLHLTLEQTSSLGSDTKIDGSIVASAANYFRSHKTPRKAQLKEVRHSNEKSTVEVLTADGVTVAESVKETRNKEECENVKNNCQRVSFKRKPVPPPPPQPPSRPPAPPPPPSPPPLVKSPSPCTKMAATDDNDEEDDAELKNIEEQKAHHQTTAAATVAIQVKNARPHVHPTSCSSPGNGEGASTCSSPDLPLPPPPSTTDTEVLPSDEPLPPPPDPQEVELTTSRPLVQTTLVYPKNSYMSYRSERKLGRQGFDGNYRRSSPSLSSQESQQSSSPKQGYNGDHPPSSASSWEKLHNIGRPGTTVIFHSDSLQGRSGGQQQAQSTSPPYPSVSSPDLSLSFGSLTSLDCSQDSSESAPCSPPSQNGIMSTVITFMPDANSSGVSCCQQRLQRELVHKGSGNVNVSAMSESQYVTSAMAENSPQHQTVVATESSCSSNSSSCSSKDTVVSNGLYRHMNGDTSIDMLVNGEAVYVNLEPKNSSAKFHSQLSQENAGNESSNSSSQCKTSLGSNNNPDSNVNGDHQHPQRISSSTQTTDTPRLSRKQKPKTKEELECERLSQDFVNHCNDTALKNLLVPAPNHKTLSDYMEGLFDLHLENGGEPVRKTLSPQTLASKVSRATSPSIENNKRDDTGILAHSGYFTTSEPKAKLLTRYSHDMGKQEWSNEVDLNSKKEDLIASIGRKLELLRAEQVLVREEMSQNEALGKEVTMRVEQLAKSNELKKYKLHVEELEKIINLLLSLSGRLARAQNALMSLSSHANEDEKRVLESKCDKLSAQHEEARRLKESIDRRSQQVSSMLHRYLSMDEYADYDHFIKMKSKLLMDAREIDEKIKLGEEQLVALQNSVDLHNWKRLHTKSISAST